jgi:hypothetical protein
LHDRDSELSVTAHYELNGFVRRKWLDIQNESGRDRLLLDVELDRYQVRGQTTEGGQGDPIFLDDQAFFALDHPAGVNEGNGGNIRLWHAPGRKIMPNGSMTSQASIAGVAQQRGSLDQFHRYIETRSPRAQKKHISIFTCYGINNQWGACPALTDSEVLDCQRVVGGWQDKGVKFDYFTMDQGWPDNSGDLTAFAPACYPDGPRANTDFPRRQLTAASAGSYGSALVLSKAERMPWIELSFADAARFEKAGMLRTTQYFSARLPRWNEGHGVLAIHVRLSESGKEYRYSPVVPRLYSCVCAWAVMICN